MKKFKIIIWGHKLYTHTTSYVHAGFFKAFKHMGFDTYWFDDLDDVSNFDFSRSLFITEGQVDKKIPKRNDCFYLLHNCDIKNYNNLKYLGLATHINPEKKEKNILYFDDNVVNMCWATDLLPIEINTDKNYNNKNLNTIYWVGTKCSGTFGNNYEIDLFVEEARKNGKNFVHSCPWRSPISFEENLRLIRESYLAPTIVGSWQKENGYIPCRIFKNISYGKMPLTNSPEIKRLFGDMVVFNENTSQLFIDANEKLNTITDLEMKTVMEYVKSNHTYINRASLVLEAFDIL